MFGEKGRKMTPDLPWFGQWNLRPLNLFLLIIDHDKREGRPLDRLHEK